jgi:hypothetical protein
MEHHARQWPTRTALVVTAALLGLAHQSSLLQRVLDPRVAERDAVLVT